MKGLINNGNTCYFNTAIQCLLNIPLLTNYITSNPYDFNGSCYFTKLYTQLVYTYWTQSDETININSLLSVFRKRFPQFTKDEEHDVQECILCIIDILEVTYPKIKNFLYGTVVQETIWPSGKKEDKEPFCVHLLHSNGTDMKQRFKESSTWNTLLEYVDDSGKTHNIATTRRIIKDYPQTLIVSFDRKSDIEIEERIKFGEDTEYILQVCAMHDGFQDTGHYTCFLKRRNKWYFADDDVIKQVPKLPEKGGYYVMVYNLKTPSFEYSL